MRLHPVEHRKRSWKADDSRLHVDAFPSRPNHGIRIVRVFANINPAGVPRAWRIGEPFEAVTRRFIAGIPPQRLGSAWLLNDVLVPMTRRVHAYDAAGQKREKPLLVAIDFEYIEFAPA